MATVSTSDVSTPAAQRRRLAVRLTFAAVVTLLLVSALMLTRFGIPYLTAGGAMPTKIHPATYLTVVALAAWARAEGTGRLAARVTVDHPGVVVFGLGIGLVAYQTVAVVKLPLAPIVDTLVLPLLLFVALIRLDDEERGHMERLLHVLMVVNATLGLLEYASGWHFTPMYEADGTLITYEWRASALLGHPLINAATTGIYLVALAFGASPRLPPLQRLSMMGVCGLAMVAFGGRVAMVTSGAMVVLALLLGTLRLAAGRRFSLGHAVLGIALVTAGLVFVTIFVDLGGADKFMSRFSNDYGSAQTRWSMLHIFSDLTQEQFLLWPSPEQIWQAQREHAIRIGVESSEVGFVANYGLFVTILFFVSLAAFLRELVVATSPKAWWVIVYFAVVMSSSLGIASKTTVLALFVVLTLSLFPKAPSPRGD